MIEHLKILEPAEIKEIYGLPQFTFEEQQQYFLFANSELEHITQLRGWISKIYFMLQLGYFKARKQFFVFTFEDVQSDVNYLISIYFPEEVIFLSSGQINKETRLEQRKQVLMLTGYQFCEGEMEEKLLKKACQLATLDSRPIYIFRDLMQWLERRQLILPSYSYMQRYVISKALTFEKNRIQKELRTFLSTDDLLELDKLLEITGENYLLTLLQQEPSSFKSREIRKLANKKALLKPFYRLAQRVLPQLHISNENIQYYGSLAEYYTIYKLKRKKAGSDLAYLYLLCFSFKQFRKMNDILVEAFIFHLRQFKEEARIHIKDKIIEWHYQGKQYIKRIPLILNLFADTTIADQTPFALVKQKAFSILNKDEFNQVMDYLEQSRVDEKTLEWNFYEQNKKKISHTLRYIFRHLSFKGSNTSENLLEAAEFAQNTFKAGKNLSDIWLTKLPVMFIPSQQKKYLFYHGQVLEGSYEVYLYQQIASKIESGDIFITDSLKYKSLEEDLIPLEIWKKDKTAILTKIDLPDLLITPQQLLSQWAISFKSLYKKVHHYVKNGLDKDISIIQKGKKTKWILHYPKDRDTESNHFYSQFEAIQIAELFELVNQKTNFLQAFTHILESDVEQNTSNENLIAAIVALATHHGLKRMADISDINHQQLVTTTKNFLRTETLKKANDFISTAISQLPVFEHYNIQKNVIHSSSDGQKYGTQFENINSRYSPKYFGLGKGVSAYTLVANHVPVNARIIGANEHESHYVFDVLYNNTSQIQPNIHSTDTHGANQVNFAILNLFGYQFAPRYKQISSQIKAVYCFDKLINYKKSLIQPLRRINTDLIIGEWDNISRIMASLALKTTTQSTIIRKLSSYYRKNNTIKALWEYDNIVKTHYLLNYILSPALRKDVHKALNRGEQYHQLQRYIAYANQGKFRVHTVQEQEVSSECTRLTANSMIYYNTLCLSKMLILRNNQPEEVELIKRTSPIAWRHIHVYGKYQFLNNQPLQEDEFIKNKRTNNYVKKVQ